MFIIRFGIFLTKIKTRIRYRSIQMRCIRNLIRPCCFSPPWTKRPPGWKNKGLTKNKGSPDFLKHFSLPGSVSRVHTLLYFPKQMQQKLVLASWCNATAGPQGEWASHHIHDYCLVTKAAPPMGRHWEAMGSPHSSEGRSPRGAPTILCLEVYEQDDDRKCSVINA